MSNYENLKELYKKHDQLELFEEKVLETCNVVMRQTDYDMETSLEKLKVHNMVAIDVVKEYMGIPLKKERESVSTNQAVFREFRTFLDDACSNYYKNKEIEAQKQEYIQKMMELKRQEEEEKKMKEEEKKLETIEED